MAILTTKQINQKVTLIVNDYISNGYTLDLNNNDCCNYANELYHIVLVPNKRSNELIRISIYKNRNLSIKHNNKTYYFDTLELSVLKYNKQNKSSYLSYSDGVYVRDTEVFYSIKNGKCYTDSLADRLSIFEIVENRKSNRYRNTNSRDISLDKVSDSFKDRIIEMIKRTPGAKRANRWDCIKSITLKPSFDLYTYGKSKLTCEVNWAYKNRSGIITFR